MPYISAANANFGALQPTPIETTNRILQASNAGEAAVKIQNLNVIVMDAVTGATIIPQNITSKVSQVFVASSATPTKKRPAYLLHVTGWLNSFPKNGIHIAGGFPSSTTSATPTSPKYVDPLVATSLNVGSTLTAYPNAILSGSSPEVYFLEGTAVTLIDDFSTGIELSMWAVNLKNIYLPTTGKFEFDLYFYLFLV